MARVSPERRHFLGLPSWSEFKEGTQKDLRILKGWIRHHPVLAIAGGLSLAGATAFGINLAITQDSNPKTPESSTPARSSLVPGSGSEETVSQPASPTATTEASPTAKPVEIVLDQKAKLFAVPDSRATAQNPDPAKPFNITALRGSFGDYFLAETNSRGEKGTVFIPAEFVKQAPVNLKKLSANEVPWFTTADLAESGPLSWGAANWSAKQIGGNIKVDSSFEVKAKLEKPEGASGSIILRGARGQQLEILFVGNKINLAFRDGVNPAVFRLDGAGTIIDGLIDLKFGNKTVSSLDKDGNVVKTLGFGSVANAEDYFQGLISAVSIAGGSNDITARQFAFFVAPDGRYVPYVEPTQTPTNTPEPDTPTPAPTQPKATPTPPPPTRIPPPPPPPTATPVPLPTATEVVPPTPVPTEKPAPVEKVIGNLQSDGFSFVSDGGPYEIGISPNTIGVPPGQNPLEANFNYINERFKAAKVKTLIKWVNNYESSDYANKGIVKGDYHRYSELNGDLLTVIYGPTTNFNIRTSNVGTDINWTLVDLIVGDLDSAMRGAPPKVQISEDLNKIVYPNKAVLKPATKADAAPSSRIVFINRNPDDNFYLGTIQNKEGELLHAIRLPFPNTFPVLETIKTTNQQEEESQVV